MLTGQVIGNTNVGALIGYGYRQCTYNSSPQNAYLQITNTYAIGNVTSTGVSGGLVGQLGSTYYGSTTTTNSYWTPETTGKTTSTAGTVKNIPTMLYKTGYGTAWNFDSIWTIEDGQTLAYLRNINKPNTVNKVNISYEDFQIEGEGTENNPYIIRNVTQLKKINENITASYKLANNIDLTGIDWTPIGSLDYKFTGILDGNGFTISNLTINETLNYQGLFGYNTGTIKNLKLQNISVNAASYSGIIAGYNTGNIINCEIGTSSITGTTYTGGITGYNTGTITDTISHNCNVTGTGYVGGGIGYNTGTLSNNNLSSAVNGTSYVGGLVGYTNKNTDNCNVEGSIVNTGDYVGGLIGYTIANVTNSKSTASVQGTSNAGGLIGYVYINNNNLNIENSEATGNVQGTTNVGGLIGSEFICHTHGVENTTYTMNVKKCYSSRKRNRNWR